MGIAVFKRIQHLLQHINLAPFLVNLNRHLPAWKRAFHDPSIFTQGQNVGNHSKNCPVFWNVIVSKPFVSQRLFHVLVLTLTNETCRIQIYSSSNWDFDGNYCNFMKMDKNYTVFLKLANPFYFSKLTNWDKSFALDLFIESMDNKLLPSVNSLLKIISELVFFYTDISLGILWILQKSFFMNVPKNKIYCFRSENS